MGLLFLQHALVTLRGVFLNSDWQASLWTQTLQLGPFSANAEQLNSSLGSTLGPSVVNVLLRALCHYPCNTPLDPPRHYHNAKNIMVSVYRVPSSGFECLVLWVCGTSRPWPLPPTVYVCIQYIAMCPYIAHDITPLIIVNVAYISSSWNRIPACKGQVNNPADCS